MGDVHFVIRHGLTGFVFVIFALAGVWIVTDWSAMDDVLNRYLARQEFTALVPASITLLITVFTVLFTTPVIGVMVQGLYTAFMYRFNRAFTDEARKVVASNIRDEVITKQITGMGKETQRKYSSAFNSMPDDSLFVWLYHSDSPPHMVDWARRRRSYHYLGVNWVIAAVLGLLTGLFLPYFVTWDKDHQITLLVVLSLLWIAGTLWLAIQMKRDVDYMELTWACARIYPRFKDLAFGSWSEEAVLRWAYGLEGAFKMKPEKKVDDLAVYLGVPKEQIQRWMDKRERVPQDIQDKITAWFHIDRRHLFSEQP